MSDLPEEKVDSGCGLSATVTVPASVSVEPSKEGRKNRGSAFLERVHATLKRATVATAEGHPRSSPRLAHGASSWGDATPDSALLAQIARMEAAAKVQSLATTSADPPSSDEVSPAARRRLAFTPIRVPNARMDVANAKSSSQLDDPVVALPSQRQLSRLGRRSSSNHTHDMAMEEVELHSSAPINQSANERCVVHHTVGSRHRSQPSAGSKRQRVSSPMVRYDGAEGEQAQQNQCTHNDPQRPLIDNLVAGFGPPPTCGHHATHALTHATMPAVHIPSAIEPPHHQRGHPDTDLRAYVPYQVYHAMRSSGGPSTLYPWQAECLSRRGVLDGRNLIYCAPTSGGKTLVSEILMLRRLYLTRRPALLVLPFVSLCAEKSASLRAALAPLGREVVEFYGGLHVAAPLGPSAGVVVATIEKANILVNRLLEEGNLGLLSCVCIDELHLVGEEDRGYQLELLLTKLRFVGRAAWQENTDDRLCGDDSDSDAIPEAAVSAGHAPDSFRVHSHGGHQGLHSVHRTDGGVSGFRIDGGIQIVGMSATLPNVDAVARWLHADLYVTTFRPVPLLQYLKVGREIRDLHGNTVRHMDDVPAAWEARDPEHVAWLAHETVRDGHSVLIFCATRASCARTATALASMLNVPEKQRPWKAPHEDQTAVAMLPDPPTRAAICEALRQDTASNEDLIASVERGVAFHHAGMGAEERELTEAAFRCGAVSVLCATSTLAAGVNLPARRVIFKHAYVGAPHNFLDATRYRQMAGRAGRAGIDSNGEAFLIAGPTAPAPKLEALMQAEPEPIESCLRDGSRGMQRAMLEVVASGVVVQPADVVKYVRCTLLAATSEFSAVVEATKAALVWLGHKERCFIVWDGTTGTYQPTAFGRAVLAAGLPPEACIPVRADLARARQALVLTTELHLAYLCVPTTIDDIHPDWQKLLNIISTFGSGDRSVAANVGLDMSYVIARAHGSTTGSLSAETAEEQERLCRRLWTALILRELVEEATVAHVQEKFGIARGTAHGLQERSARFAGMVSAFCERLGWHELELLISKYQARIVHGVRPEIVKLLDIQFVKAYTARLLYSAGLRTPEMVAEAGVKRVAAALEAGKRKASRPQVNATVSKASKFQASRIIKAAQQLLQRRAKELEKEATEALRLAALTDD